MLHLSQTKFTIWLIDVFVGALPVGWTQLGIQNCWLSYSLLKLEHGRSMVLFLNERAAPEGRKCTLESHKDSTSAI